MYLLFFCLFNDNMCNICLSFLKQQQLFEKAINRNLIISLPTGTGKTLIAINLIKYNLHQTDGTYPDVARRSVFIAPTRVLVDQQYDEICSLLKSTSVGKFHGELNVCGYNKKAWSQHWNNYRVLLFTPAVLYSMLNDPSLFTF